MNLRQRIGKFCVERECILDKCELAADAFAVMAFVPLRAELLGWQDRFEYIGISPLFDDISLGERVPEYEVAITVEKIDGLDKVKAVNVRRKIDV